MSWNIGDKFRALRSTEQDVSEGTVYTIEGIDSYGDPFFLDDANDPNYSLNPEGDLMGLDEPGYERVE